MNNKLREMMRAAGFLPDNDLIEFGEMILEECIKIISPDQATLIKRHFGLMQ